MPHRRRRCSVALTATVRRVLPAASVRLRLSAEVGRVVVSVWRPTFAQWKTCVNCGRNDSIRLFLFCFSLCSAVDGRLSAPLDAPPTPWIIKCCHHLTRFHLESLAIYFHRCVTQWNYVKNKLLSEFAAAGSSTWSVWLWSPQRRHLTRIRSGGCCRNRLPLVNTSIKYSAEQPKSTTTWWVLIIKFRPISASLERRQFWISEKSEVNVFHKCVIPWLDFVFFSLPRASKLITDFHFVELRCGLVTEADPLDRSDSPAIDRSLQKRLMQLRWNSNFPKSLSVDLWRPLLSISGFRRKPWVLCRVAIGLSLSSRFSVLKHKNLITCFRLDRRKKSHLMDSFRGLLLSNTKHSAHRQSTFPSSALVCQNDQFDGIWPIFLI